MSLPHSVPLPMNDRPSDLTEALRAWSHGDQQAGERLLPAVYDELHRQAVLAMRRESAGHTLQPTALVNETYLRLIDQRRVEWQNRAHFFGVCAQLMRRILVDHARRRLAEKHGGGVVPISISEIDLVDRSGEDAQDLDILSLHEALERLAVLDPDAARLVELRYFTGMTIEETAEVLGDSPATVKREWVFVRAWLRGELEAA